MSRLRCRLTFPDRLRRARLTGAGRNHNLVLLQNEQVAVETYPTFQPEGVLMRYPIVAVLAVALSSPALGAAPNMKEGLWEITTRTEMAGMPPGGMKPMVVRQCVTKKDLDDPRKTAPGGDPKDNRCQVTDHKVQGNTATWNVACKGEGAMTGTGSVTYSGDTYTGVSRMKMKQGGKDHEMTIHYAGKRLGECKGQ